MKIIHGRDGYSLTEIIVAFTVLMIASLGLFYLTTTTTTGTLRSQQQAASMQLAVDKLEELKNTMFNNLASSPSGGETITAGGATGGIYTRTWTVTNRTIAGVTARDIAVSVGWTGGGTVSLTSTVVQVNQVAQGYPTVFIDSWDQSR